MSRIPDKPTPDGLEERWIERWESEGTYRFDRTAARDQVYSVDTPPPTASGSLHVGHVFSYTHTDLVARYQRMAGKHVFYPMGWDDNGLPSERRVQNYYGVACDPSLPYDPDFTPPEEPHDPPLHISRPNFVELCLQLTAEDEEAFAAVWRRLGLSVDWNHQYRTIAPEAIRTSQRMFLRNLARGEAYASEAPTIWDVGFQTAVAQAEIEDREKPGAYHRIAFERVDREGDIEIDTTRPELLPACVALVAHPDDERFQPLFGTKVRTPLFGAEIEIRPHELAAPDKGTGIAMICTFGDTTDVIWWRELDLSIRAILARDGRLQPVEWGSPGWESADAPAAQAAYDELAGLYLNQAKRKIVEQLGEAGALRGEPREIVHPVKFFEKGDRPLEIVTSRQWYIRNGGHDADLRDDLLARGRELTWHPDYMGKRYESWVEGLNGDWLISRQRFFGVPFPVWYPIGDDGVVDHDHPLLPSEDRLPIDPTTDVPDGYDESQRNQPGGFAADADVMDTWATSSLTPQIAGGWEEDPDLWERVSPFDVRPQGHDIIRTWLFSTVTRAHFEDHAIPWRNATISGWILDPDRKKMSKSKGNVLTPIGLLKQYGSDAVRYWAANGRPGVDTAFDETVMKVGRRLAMKLLNASKFVLNLAGEDAAALVGGEVTEPIDRALLTELAGVVDVATRSFDDFDYARALERTEALFWRFTDDYVELVKGRAYGAAGDDAARSAHVALATALSMFHRLLAPFLPFVAAETWSWWQDGSVHNAAWPTTAELPGDGDPTLLTVAGDALREVRRAKTEAKTSLRTEAETVVVSDTAERLALLDQVRADVIDAGKIRSLSTQPAEEFAVAVTLATND
ncbi:MAG: valine--tRNA ligase [Actinomycetota bacterium]